MNIILVGMMGSGKTTIGKELSKNFPEFDYIDIDEEIERSTQKKISEIFLQHGESFFRMLESEKIAKICQKNNQIISTGGGAFENPQNREILLNCGNVIYLKASPEEIFNRIKAETHRPLLRKDFSIEKISKILNLREDNYKKAHRIIDTDKKTPEQIVSEIVGVLND